MSTAEATERCIDTKPTATINTDSDGEILGVALFLGKDDLTSLGVSNATQIQYAVENGHLKLREVTTE